jgi:hypothetical protein
MQSPRQFSGCWSKMVGWWPRKSCMSLLTARCRYKPSPAQSIIHCGQIARKSQLSNAGKLIQSYNIIYKTINNFIKKVNTIIKYI